MLGLQLSRPSGWRFGKGLTEIQRNMEGLLDDYSTLFPEFTDRKEFCNPACDLEETDNEYSVTLDVPGMKKEEIKVEWTDSVLTISGDHKEEHLERGKRRLMERYHGRFERTFELPSAGTDSKIDAQYCDGVLKIAVTKTAGSKVKRIPITEGSASPSVRKAVSAA